MAMVVKNNMSALSTLNTLNKNTKALSKSLQKVSSGMKINSAADDLLRRAEDHVIDVEALEVFKHHIGSHAPFSFQFQV